MLVISRARQYVPRGERGTLKLRKSYRSYMIGGTKVRRNPVRNSNVAVCYSRHTKQMENWPL